MSAEDASVPWRLQSLESRMNKLEAARPEILAERVANLAADFRSFKEEYAEDQKKLDTRMTGVTRVMISLLATLAGSSALVILTLALTKRAG